MGLSLINSLITKWTFKSMLIKRAYTKEQFEQLAARSAFGRSKIQENQIRLEVWLAK